MHLSILAAALLSQVPVPIPVPGGAGDDASSPVVGLYPLDRVGSAAWAGAPSPTWDCRPSAAGGEVSCTGATATKEGTPTTVASSFWADGIDAAPWPAVALNGSTDWYSLGTGFSPAGSFTLCAAFEASTTSGSGYVVSKMGGAGPSAFALYRNGSGVTMYVINGSGASFTTASTEVAAGVPVVACGSYQYVGAGTSVVRLQANQRVASPVTDAVGPLRSSASTMRIGANADGGAQFAGKIIRATFWDGWAASAAEMLLAVDSMQGRIMSAPLISATFSRNGSEVCCLSGDAACVAAPQNTPCINRQGAQFGGSALGYMPIPSRAKASKGFSVFVDLHAETMAAGATPEAIFSIGTMSAGGTMAGYFASNVFTCAVWDSAGHSVYRTSGALGSFGTAAAHRFGCQHVPGSPPLLYVDGRSVTDQVGGTGTGVLGSFPAEGVQLGNLTAVGWPLTNKQISGVAFCQGMSMGRCEERSGVSRYSLLSRRLLALGDSITYGFGLPHPDTDAWPVTLTAALVAQSDSRWTVTNGAVGGHKSADTLGEWVNTYSTGYYRDVAVMVGINDCNTGVPAETVWANKLALYESIRSKDARVIAIDILPGSATDEGKACQHAVNTLQHAYCATGAATCVNAHELFANGMDELDAYWGRDLSLDGGAINDGVHLGVRGENRLAYLVGTMVYGLTANSDGGNL